MGLVSAKAYRKACLQACRAAGDGTKGPRDQGTKGPRDQGTKGPRDQRTKGPKDHWTLRLLRLKDPGRKGPRQTRPHRDTYFLGYPPSLTGYAANLLHVDSRFVRWLRFDGNEHMN